MYLSIHEERNNPKTISFTDSHTLITLADGRIIGIPLEWTPFLQDATPEERRDFIFAGHAVYWENFDDGFDLDALISGQYTRSHYAKAE